MTYLPTANLSPLLTFTQFSSTVGALQTALIAAYPSLNIQVVADTLSGETTNAVVISNNSTVFTVPPGSYVGYNNGQWTQYTAAKLAQLFTVYP
jgi:Tfp pilus assembly protein PilP